MLYCTDLNCPNPFNADEHRFCSSCGCHNLLSVFRSRYRVIKLLEQNQYSRTYEARDCDRLNDPCIIKQVTPQQIPPKIAELFGREAELLKKLGKHPQIPQLLAYFQEGQHSYLVQEWMEGQTLLQELQQTGAFNEAKIWQLLNDILPVLQLIHGNRVIHRNIKPDNLIRRPQNGQLVLIDFNVSKDIAGGTRNIGTKVGTRGYIPKEQMSGQVFPCSDLYSLGVTCLRLLTGCLPREDGRDDLRDGRNHRWLWRENLPQGIRISAHLGQILKKMVREKYQDRYSSAKEVISAIASPSTLSSVPSKSTAKPTQNSTQFFNQTANNSTVAPQNATQAASNPTTLSQTVTQTANRPTNPTPNPPTPDGGYSCLQHLLASQQWKEANQETIAFILRVAGKATESDLIEQDIQFFPCTELRTIDQLWVKYSKGRFGFSIQKEIWCSLGGDDANEFEFWERFGQRVGWRVRKWGILGKPNWRSYDEMTFKLNAPKGNLPRVGCWLSILARLDECEL
ncbi:MAG: serine/threonine-protein kinase [Cyanobacteriota bacterium]|nr:serine/threonine-protein kinase [Cyanobacteriota bacterium]